MKKLFKIGTTLAFSVLFNLSPMMLSNVYAEESKATDDTEIVEEVLAHEEQYVNVQASNNANIEIEEPLVVEPVVEEKSTAESNNVVVTEPTRGPTNEVVNEPTRDADPVEADEPVDPKVILHVVDGLGQTKDITYTYSGGSKKYKITELINRTWYDGFEVRVGATTYTFEGWYDLDGNRITDVAVPYGDGEATIAQILPGSITNPADNARPNGIQLKTNTLTQVIEITIVANWTYEKTAILHFDYIDNVSTGTGNWSDPEGHTEIYTHTFSNPEDKDPEAYYDFLYWQFVKSDDYEVDTNAHYEKGDTITFDLSSMEDGFDGSVTAYAWWQPYVTLELYSYKSNLNVASRYSRQSDPYQVSLYGGQLTEEPTKPGYRFTGWYDFETDQLVSDEIFYSPDPSSEVPDGANGVNVPRVVRLYATWERIEEYVTVTKNWNDTSNEREHRPEELVVNVYASDQEEVYRTLTLTGDMTADSWTSERFLIYPFDVDGNPIIYTAEEIGMDCYETTPEELVITENGLTITNNLKDDGKVTILYQDEDGKVFTQYTNVIEDTIDSEFTASAIEIPDYELYQVTVNGEVVEETDITGKITENDQTVIYWYKQTIGYIRIHHVDVNGTYITKDKNDPANPVEYRQTISGTIGEDYTAEPLDIYGYKCISTSGTDFDGGDNEELGIFTKIGKFTKEGFDIFFNYAEVEGRVIVHHVDIDNPETDLYTDLLTGNVGDHYATSVKEDIESYDYVSVDGDVEGTFVDGDIEVTYYYQKRSGQVLVYYKDLFTGEDIVPSEVLSGYVDEEYKTEPFEIKGYRFVRTYGVAEGYYPENTSLTVIHWYQQVGKVIIQHLEVGTEKVLAEVEPKIGPIGGEYTTDSVAIEGYHFVELVGNDRGTYTVEDQTVTYYYEEDVVFGDLFVDYIDTDGKPIENYSYTDTQPVGTTYSTETFDIDGYTYKFRIGNADGEYVQGTTTVTYVYAKVAYGTLEVNYVDMDGNPIEDYSYTDTQVVGTDYSTEAYDIDGYTYKFVSGDSTGKYIDGKVVVTYVYEMVEEVLEPVPAYVLVHYMFGTTPLADDVVIPGFVGDEFVTQTKAFDGYTLVNIRKEVQPITRGTTPDYMANGYGVFAEGVTVIWYEYEKVEEEIPVSTTGVVISHYVDENGNAISSDEFFYGNIGDIYYTSQKVILGYTGSSIPSNRIGTIDAPLMEVYYEYTKDEVEEEEESCNHGCCNTCCCGNQCEENSSEDNQPAININITINNDPNVEYNPVNNNEVTTGEVNVEVIPTVSNNTNVETGDNNIENNSSSTVTTGDTNVEIGDATNTSENTNDAGKNTNVNDNTCTDCKDSSTKEEEKEDKKTGSVVAHYVDIYGRMIGYDLDYSGNVGEDYSTKNRMFRGYDLVQVVGEANGQYQTNPVEVTYIYLKKEEAKVDPADSEDPVKEEVKPMGGTSVVEAKRVSYPNTIEVPNTGVTSIDSSNYLYGILAFLLMLLEVLGFALIEREEN